MADQSPLNPPPTDATPQSSGGAVPRLPQETIPPEVLRSAYNAFKKRWKLTNLDQISQIGRGPMSSGQKSTISGITPPDQFPAKVWNELAKQGRLKYVGAGCYALP